jgi:hypothetical protein
MSTDPKWIPKQPKRDPAIIQTHSIVSHRTARGIVVIEWGDMGGQFDPEDARIFAHRLLREADNAETDAFIYDVLKNKVEAPAHVIGGFLTQFREDRARREQAAGLRRAADGDEIPEVDRR